LKTPGYRCERNLGFILTPSLIPFVNSTLAVTTGATGATPSSLPIAGR
jgi:hypothetical protein